MSFTGEDLKTIAELYMNVTIPENDVVSIVNQGLNRMATLGHAYGEKTFSGITADTFQTFTDDVIGITLVLDANDNIYNLWQYEEGDGIKFNSEGDYDVLYKQIPSDISSVTDSININDLYKTPLSKYLAGFVKLQRNDTSPDGTRLMREFERLSASAYNTLISARKPTEVRVGQNV